MKWKVDFYDLFFEEFKDYSSEVQKELLARLEALKVFKRIVNDYQIMKTLRKRW